MMAPDAASNSTSPTLPSAVPASSSTNLPMGARLRLKSTRVLTGFSPEVQRIFRAMQRYGLIVADNLGQPADTASDDWPLHQQRLDCPAYIF